MRASRPTATRRDRPHPLPRWAAAVLPVLLLATSACSEESDGDGGHRRDRDSPEIGMVAATGDAVRALQHQRRYTAAVLLDQPVPSAGNALESGDAMDALAVAVRELDGRERLDAEVELGEAVSALTTLENDLVRVWPTDGSYDDGGVLTGRFGPIITSLLDLQRHFADTTDDPVVDTYTRATRTIEDLLEIARIAEGGDPTWPDAVQPHHDAVVEAHSRLLDVAETSPELADATQAFERTLADAGFGTPPSPGPPDAFVASLALDAWLSYHDEVREHLPDPEPDTGT